MTSMTLLLLNSPDRTEILNSALDANNKKKAVRDYINRDELVDKYFTLNKIGHLT